MISKERLEELITQGATIWYIQSKEVMPYTLDEDKDYKDSYYTIDDDCLCFMKTLDGLVDECEYAWLLENLFETLEEVQWHKEFGCIERTENLKLLPYEEICDGCGYDFVFSTPNHCRVTMFIGGNEIFMYKGISSCWSWELTKENYTLACRKAKELFLGEKDE